MLGCMTTMPIHNYPFTQRRLQFIGIGVNKLTLTSIDILQSSNYYHIVSSFICWNQNIVYKKILHTTFKMTKRKLGLGVKAVLLLWIICVIMSCVCPAFVSLHYCLVVICWERADLLALDFWCLIVCSSLPCGIQGQVWFTWLFWFLIFALFLTFSGNCIKGGIQMRHRSGTKLFATVIRWTSRQWVKMFPL